MKSNCSEVPDPTPLQFKGQLPSGFTGIFYRNGPGTVSIGKTVLQHPYDGDGLVCSITFADGKAHFRSRYVQTEGYLADQAAQRPNKRGVFGSGLPGGVVANALELEPKNTANTSVLAFAGRLFAAYEAGQPYEMDPVTLETLEPCNLDGEIRRGGPFALPQSLRGMYSPLQNCLSMLRQLRGLQPAEAQLGGDALCAHWCIDPQTGNLVSISYQIRMCPGRHQGNLCTALTIREYTPAFVLASRRKVTLDGYAFLHDFAITPSHIVLVQNPIVLRIWPFLSGQLCPIHCLEFDQSRDVLVHLVPRSTHLDPAAVSEQEDREGWGVREDASTDDWIPGGSAKNWQQRPQQYALPGHFVTHVANAWIDDAERLHVQYIGYPQLPDFLEWSGPGADFRQIDPDGQPPSLLLEAVVPLGPGPGASSVWQLSDRVLEFPVVNPAFATKPTRFVFAAAARNANVNAPQQVVARYDTHTGQVATWGRGEAYFPGEPCFVAKDSGSCGGQGGQQGDSVHPELQGWLVTIAYDGERHVSEVIVLDANDLEQGPVASADLPVVLPHGLHGTWAS